MCCMAIRNLRRAAIGNRRSEEQRDDAERTSELVVRLKANVIPGEENLRDSETQRSYRRPLSTACKSHRPQVPFYPIRINMSVLQRDCRFPTARPNRNVKTQSGSTGATCLSGPVSRLYRDRHDIGQLRGRLCRCAGSPEAPQRLLQLRRHHHAAVPVCSGLRVSSDIRTTRAA